MTYNAETSSSPPRVAFVDDDPRVLAGLSLAMRKMSAQWEMHFIERSPDVLEMSKEQPFDVIMTDLRMPEMTGLQLVKAVNDLYPETLCMVLTASDGLENAIIAINEVSVFKFYEKPRPATELIQGIKDALAYADWHAGSVAEKIHGLADLGYATLDSVPVATIMLTRDCKVVFMNKLGANLLAEEKVLTLSPDQVCRCQHPRATIKLRDAIRALCDDDAGVPPEMLVVLPQIVDEHEHARPIVVSLYRLPSREIERDRNETLVAMFLANPDGRSHVPSEMLQQLFGIARSEAELVSHLVDGTSLADAAGAMRITINTARTYLKRIFSKTGTSRQAELIRVVLTSISSSHI